MPHSPKQVYEWGLLPLAKNDDQPGPQEITQAQWKALGEYNEAHRNRYFAVQTNGIRFYQFVGVIQVGSLTIEVLPKIDKRESEDRKGIWQAVLIDMLRQCHWLDQHAHDNAPLRIRHRSILEAYLALFLGYCEAILHRGLVKRYRPEESNKYALKGKLLFAQQVRHNAVHAERFYTRHRVYDADNLLNRILLKAIRLVPRLSTHGALKDRVGRLLLDFPELDDVRVDADTFERIRYDRKTAHYQDAINIAAMLLLHYRPDVRGGNRHVLAILFDMNDLWEEYVYRRLKRDRRYEVQAQDNRVFWRPHEGRGHKKIRPDLVVRDRAGSKPIIIDTKWKVPDGRRPDDADLKQMFAYNEYWGAGHAILLYPDAHYRQVPDYVAGGFGEEKGRENQRHGCAMLWVSVLKQEADVSDKERSRLDPKIGERILNHCVAEKLLRVTFLLENPS